MRNKGKITDGGREMRGRKWGGIVGHEGLLWILVSCSSRGSCPPISSHLLVLLPLLPPHVPPTLRQEHADDGMCGPFLVPCLLFPSQVCMWLSARIGLTCESVCEAPYVDCDVVLCECVCARVFLCVSVPEKADLRELCSTFIRLLIHPLLSLCLPDWTGWKERRRRRFKDYGYTETDSKQSFLLSLYINTFCEPAKRKNQWIVDQIIARHLVIAICRILFLI